MNDFSRRDFVAFGAALAASSLARPAAAQASPQRIDTHHHFLPPGLASAIGAKRENGTPKWTPEMSLADMDKNGIATSLISVVQPGVWLGDVQESRKLSRECNEYGAKLVSDHPGRFGLMAAIAPPDVDGCLREIEYAFDKLKCDGIGLMTSYDGKYLGDKAFAPVMDELHRRKALIYTHPTEPQCCMGVVPGVGVGTIEYATDTTRTIASLVFSGTAQRCEDIRFIWSHGGGTLPFLVGRFETAAAGKKAAFPNGTIPILRRFYYEIAQAHHAGALDALMRLVPISQVCFGTDFPFRQAADAVTGLAKYEFSAMDRRAIDRDNALRLVPRLKA
jgi:predicted TIM-barrel fold metal-dependent hydrolase